MNDYTRKKIYKFKKYPHFDPKIHWKSIYRLVESSEYISKHSFYPFIHYSQKSYKFPKSYLEGSSETRGIPKLREIMYSSHFDRYIYEYYAYLVNEKYNKRVNIDGTSRCAVAYRNNLHKNNVHFAKEAFDSIRKKGEAYILIGDFTSFFDNMSHSYLKKMLCSLFETHHLSDDFFAVFQSITKYSYIDLEIIKENKPLSKKQFYELDRLYTPEEFRAFKKGNIHRNSNDYGIPQGSAISAVFSNVYLLDFDKKINNFITSQGGFYRRYCDDFIVVLPNNGSDRFLFQKNEVQSIISAIPRLILQPQKAKAYHYSSGHVINYTNKVFPECEKGNDIINYLGFSFDGSKISIRQKTISKYYRRMYRKADTIVSHNGISQEGKRIPRTNIYKSYSKYGKTVRKSTDSFSSSKHKGNFLSYVERSEKIFGPNESISRDTKRAWGKLMKRLNKNSSERNH